MGSSVGRQGVGLGRVAAERDAGVRGRRLKPSTVAGPPGCSLLPAGTVPATPSLSWTGSSAPALVEVLLLPDGETSPGPPEVLAVILFLTVPCIVGKLPAGLTKAEGSLLPNDE